MARNPAWDREELILALDTYVRHGLLHKAHPEVLELSRVLDLLASDVPRPEPKRLRNPNDVAMKLANFAAIDPDYPGDELGYSGHCDLAIWEEFDGDHPRL